MGIKLTLVFVGTHHHHCHPVDCPLVDVVTSILCPMIGSCQTNVERCKVGLDRLEQAVMRSAIWPIPVSWEQRQADLEARDLVPIC